MDTDIENLKDKLVDVFMWNETLTSSDQDLIQWCLNYTLEAIKKEWAEKGESY